MIIDCGFFILRPLQASDRDNLVKYGNNKNIWRNMRDVFPHPYNINDADKMIERSQGSSSIFCIDYENECVGVIGCFPQSDVYSRSAELGYWLAEPYWSKGIMSTAVKRITDHMFETHDIARIYAGVFEWNPASMKVLEKCGFKYEGIAQKAVYKDGELINEHRYGLVKT